MSYWTWGYSIAMLVYQSVNYRTNDDVSLLLNWHSWNWRFEDWLVMNIPPIVSCTLPETNSSPLKIGLPNRKVVFQPSIFRSYVSFREGIWYIKAIGWDERRPTPRRLISQDTKRPSPRSPFDDCFVDMFFFTGVLQGSISDRFFCGEMAFFF